MKVYSLEEMSGEQHNLNGGCSSGKSEYKVFALGVTRDWPASLESGTETKQVHCIVLH